MCAGLLRDGYISLVGLTLIILLSDLSCCRANFPLRAAQTQAPAAKHRLRLNDYGPKSHVVCTPPTHLHNVPEKGADANNRPDSVVKFNRAPEPVYDLRFCLNGPAQCCNRATEEALFVESQLNFRTLTQDNIVGLAHTLESRTSKFDKFFRDLLINARNDLHLMFKRTYGFLYEQNSDIFIRLFDSLSAYYTSPINLVPKLPSLDHSIDSFYKQLYQRMFRILNQPYHFNASYFECMGAQMDQLKPFGDGPDKMKQQINRSLIGAKTFVHGLMTGRDVVRQLMSFTPSDSCKATVMRLRFCSFCDRSSKPCKPVCIGAMKRCFADFEHFDHIWNDYLQTLIQLLNRLQGPFNIELVIDPINVKISDAIMTFQDRGQEITDQIFQGCGQPPRIHKRSVKENLIFPSKFSAKSNVQSSKASVPGTNLDRLVKDISEKLILAKDFWRHLPATMCNDEKLASQDNKLCLNELPDNSASLTGSKTKSRVVDNRLVAEQVDKLKTVIFRLRKAYDGERVDFRSTATLPPGYKSSASSSAEIRKKSDANGNVKFGKFGPLPKIAPNNRTQSFDSNELRDDVTIEGSGSLDFDEDPDSEPSHHVTTGSGFGPDVEFETDDEDLLNGLRSPGSVGDSDSARSNATDINGTGYGVEPFITVTVTEPFSTVTNTEPFSTGTVSEPFSTGTLVEPFSTATASGPFRSGIVTEPFSTVTVPEPFAIDRELVLPFPTNGESAGSNDSSTAVFNGSGTISTAKFPISTTAAYVIPTVRTSSNQPKPPVYVVFEGPSTTEPKAGGSSPSVRPKVGAILLSVQILFLISFRWFEF